MSSTKNSSEMRSREISPKLRNCNSSVKNENIDIISFNIILVTRKTIECCQCYGFAQIIRAVSENFLLGNNHFSHLFMFNAYFVCFAPLSIILWSFIDLEFNHRLTYFIFTPQIGLASMFQSILFVIDVKNQNIDLQGNNHRTNTETIQFG